jgi:hypothetical protein
MEQHYQGSEEIISGERFHRWIMAADGVEKSSYRPESNMAYSYGDCIINFLEEQSKIEIIVKGDEGFDFDQICESIEKSFLRLKKIKR